jgi:hypothetical protein
VDNIELACPHPAFGHPLPKGEGSRDQRRNTFKHRRANAWIPLVYLCVFLFFSLPLHAEIIDRMVAVVEGHIITLSDLRQERDIRARLGEKTSGDDASLISEMIDNYLIERQSQDFPGVDVTPDEIDAELKNSPPQEGTASAAVRAEVGRRIRMQKYFDLRFRQFIRPTDEELQKYYDDIFLPRAREQKLNPIPTLRQITDSIRNNVVQEQLNHEINIWLEAIRARSNIEVFE